MTVLLELDGVSCGYGQPSSRWRHRADPVVRGVTLQVRRGEVLGIVGESGSGKTTLIRAMLGLLRPLSGRVSLAGQQADAIPALARARLVQAVFQDPYSSLNPHRSVLDIVQQPLDIHRAGSGPERVRRAAWMCELVGLTADHQRGGARHLSGGQRQRVAIARALVLQPPLLICDEPTSALDVSVQAQILNLLLALQAQLDLAIVFVSHNLAVVEHIATHVAVLSRGEVVEQGPVASVVREPRHPYTRTLLEAVLRVDGRSALLARPGGTQAPLGAPF